MKSRENFKFFSIFCMLEIVNCLIGSFSSHADNIQKAENQSKNVNIESHISQALKSIVAQALSTHSRPIECALILGDDPCKKSDGYYEVWGDHLKTPLDVYCAAKQECCNRFNNLRDRERYCECYANQLRTKSYHLDAEAIKKYVFPDKDDYCERYGDYFVESDMVYEMFFYTCTSKILDIEFCDKLAQTTRKLIYDAIIKGDKNMVYAPKFQLYISEYNEIVNSKEFQTLFEGR